MKKLLNKPWFVAVLALAALVFVGNAVYQGTRGPAYGSGAAASAEAIASAEGAAVAEGETVRLPVNEALKALVIPKSDLRDPFAQRAKDEVAAAAVENVAAPDFLDTVHLSALWTQSGATFTLINDRICQAGDAIGRLTVESATQDGVWLTHWKGRDFVALGGDFTLRTPSDSKHSAAASSL